MSIIIIPKFANIGAGAGQVFKQETAKNTAEFKSIAAGAGISVTNNATDITIANTAAAPINMWEQSLGMYWYCSYAAYNIANPDLDLQGKDYAAATRTGDLVSLHENYDGSTIKARLAGYFFEPGDTNSITINVKARWRAKEEELDIAYVKAGRTFTITKAGAATYRCFVSDLEDLDPDGAYAVGKVLMLRFDRTDAGAINPIITHTKLRYGLS